MWQQLKQFVKQLFSKPANLKHDWLLHLTGDRIFFGKTARDWPLAQRPFSLDTTKLARHDLPQLADETALAGWLHISQQQLYWYTFNREWDRVWHYVRFALPKRNGGRRVILAPKPKLKQLQGQILHDLLAKVPVHPQGMRISWPIWWG